MLKHNRGEGRRIARLPERAAVLPRPWPVLVGWSPVEGREWLVGCLRHEVEQRRLFPWIAVCFGLGILLFFQADGQPALWAPVGALALCCGGAFTLRRNLAAMAALIGLAALFAGFSAGVVRARSVAAPVLPRVTIAPVTGFIEAVEDREGGKRLLLRVADIQGGDFAARPALIRVSVRKAGGLL